MVGAAHFLDPVFLGIKVAVSRIKAPLIGKPGIERHFHPALLAFRYTVGRSGDEGGGREGGENLAVQLAVEIGDR